LASEDRCTGGKRRFTRAGVRKKNDLFSSKIVGYPGVEFSDGFG
jgi:hypothetical protein